MDDQELLAQCYHAMYQGMIQKDMHQLDEILDESFVLVHMTGMRQNKRQYMDAIANGTLCYFSERTESVEVSVHGRNAQLDGRSRVSAAVFGGGKHTWKLRLSMKAVQNAGRWHFTEALASTW